MKTNAATKTGADASVISGRGLWWVVICTVAAAVGIAVARPVAELVREPLSNIFDGMPTVALFGAIVGACLGLGQALVRRGRRGAPPVWWVLISSVSGAVGYLLGANLATALTDPIRGRVLVYFSEVLAYLVLGAMLGLLFGLAQAWLSCVDGREMVRWTALSVLGWALGFVVAAGVGLVITHLPSDTVRDLIFGGFTGLTAAGLEALAQCRRRRV